MSELQYLIALMQTPNVGAVTARNLLSHCGSAESVFKAKKSSLLKIPNIGEAIAAGIVEETTKENSLNLAEKEIAFAEKNGIQILSYRDAAYPERLKRLNDAPIVLFYRGTANLNHGRIISIVGTRTPTPYGKNICEQIVEAFLPYDVVIGSGLAYGVDVTAHKKSLDLEIPTVGVMGTGLSQIYPADNRPTALRMCDKGGLLTEYISSQKIDSRNFPMRNRIIAGMCDAVLVIETQTRGGSMITAKQAINLGKEVFAVPGRVGDKFSAGCNDLIKQRLAHVLDAADEVAEFLGWKSLDANKQTQLFPTLSENEKIVYDIIKQFDNGVLIDTISYTAQKNHGEIAGALFNLECKNLVRALPGKKFLAR